MENTKINKNFDKAFFENSNLIREAPKLQLLPERTVEIPVQEYKRLIKNEEKLLLLEAAIFENALIGYTNDELRWNDLEGIIRNFFPVHYNELLDTLREAEAEKEKQMA